MLSTGEQKRHKHCDKEVQLKKAPEGTQPIRLITMILPHGISDLVPSLLKTIWPTTVLISSSQHILFILVNCLSCGLYTPSLVFFYCIFLFFYERMKSHFHSLSFVMCWSDPFLLLQKCSVILNLRLREWNENLSQKQTNKQKHNFLICIPFIFTNIL